MKKTLLIAALAAYSFALQAQPAEGYYRVQNAYTSRYVFLNDDGHQSKSEITSSNIDVSALRSYKGFDNIVSWPSAVVYLQKNGSKTDMLVQGYNTSSFTGGYDIKYTKNGSYYKLSGSISGVSVYISDAATKTSVEAALTTKSSTTRDWNFLPVTTTGDNYFGITPEQSADGSYYASIYASFPFKPYSSGMNVYSISKVDTERGVVVMKEISGNIPAATPVVVKCSAATATGNRLNLLAPGTSTSTVTDNLLKGVYFGSKRYGTMHGKRTQYVASTMRVLGKTADGSIGFVKLTTTSTPAKKDYLISPNDSWDDPTTNNYNYLPANKAYLTVSSTAPSELKLMTEKEYEELVAASISGVTADDTNARPGIYTLSGIRISATADDLDRLPAGVYIVNGKKQVVR